MSEPGPARAVARFNGALAAVLLTVFVNMMGLSIIFPLLPLWAQKFGAGPDDVGLLVSTFAVGQFVFAFVWGWVSDHWGRRPVILLALVGTLGSFLLMIFTDSLLWLFIARALAGAMGGSFGGAQAYVTDVTAPETRARAMGWFAGAFSLGFILGPAIGGLLAGADAANPDFRSPFIAGAAISAVALLLGEKRLIFAAGLAAAIGMALFPVAGEVWVIIVGSGLLAAGIGFAEPALNAILSHAVPAKRRGAVMGAAASSRGLGMVFGPTLAGLAFVAYGRHAPFVAGAVVLALGLILVAGLRPRAALDSG